MTRRIISISLYGDEPLYWKGAIANAELAPRFYPGWTCRIYHDETVPAAALLALHERGCELVPSERRFGPLYGRYWRLRVAADISIERFIVRDADSRLNSREQAAVAQWIDSGLPLHVMRDGLAHRKPMLAGMWGGLGGIVPDIEALIDGWGRYDQHGQADDFVSEHVWPRFCERHLGHDDWLRYPGSVPFPPHAPMELTGFVGEVVRVDEPPIDIWREAAKNRFAFVEERRRFRAMHASKRDLEARVRELEVALADHARRLREVLAERDTALDGPGQSLVVEPAAMTPVRSR
jgi:hypothetical protein